jgi:hypothetical protein
MDMRATVDLHALGLKLAGGLALLRSETERIGFEIAVSKVADALCDNDAERNTLYDQVYGPDQDGEVEP